MRDESLRTQIALGWITNLLIGCLMFTFMIMESALADNAFRALRRDPGVEGLKFLVYMVPFYTLMPVYVYAVGGLRSRVFRWIAVVMAALGLFFFLLHHLSHWYFGTRPDLSSHVLDLSLHAIGIWVLVNSIRWARLPAAARDVDQAPAAAAAARASR
jgi:hypothetical protein